MQLSGELAAAVERSPELAELRLHLATLLVDRPRYAEGAGALQCGAGPRTPPMPELSRCCNSCSAGLAGANAPGVPTESTPEAGRSFDWGAAEKQVADIVKPAFVEEPAEAVNENDFDAVQRSALRLTDIAGMADVKKQLELSLLGPIRNPDLMKAFKVSARGGLLLYGPPGCGKTFIAKAVSGELGANFYQVGIADVLSRWLGESEHSVRAIFDNARRNAPCVLFFDEVDALGHRRSALSGSAGLRTVVNALLEELDSATSNNDGVYATWCDQRAMGRRRPPCAGPADSTG